MRKILSISYIIIWRYLRENDIKFEPFHNRGLHFLHINVNSLLM